MNHPPLRANDDDGFGMLLGHVPGTYRPLSSEYEAPAFLALYLNSSLRDCPYSFHYWGQDGSWNGDHSPFSSDEPIERALLVAWWEYRVEPHLWTVSSLDAVLKASRPTEIEAEFEQRHGHFKSVVEGFRKQWQARGLIYGTNTASYEADRLFYPDPPAENWPQDEGAAIFFEAEMAN